jgi:Uma2 family endonuclease
MLMSVAPEEFRMSVEAYLALDNASPQTRYEYLDGQVLMMSGGSAEHALISANVITSLNRTLGDSPCLVFTSDARVKLSDARYVYPDVTVSCTTPLPQGTQSLTEPIVIVEVLSPSTEVYDRGEKLLSYRACPTLQAVLLISQNRPIVEVYRRQSADIWTVQTYTMDDTFPLDAISVTLSVAEIYRRVPFPAPSSDAAETTES